MQANPAHEADSGGLSEGLRQTGPSGAALFASCDPPSFSDAIAASGTRPCRILFAYGGLPVIGELQLGSQGSELRLLVVVGRLPYSVESRDEREKMLSLIRAFPTDMGESLVIAPDQSICVSTAAPAPFPLTPAGFLSELVVRLFRLDPVLRSLADILPDLAPALAAFPAAQSPDPRDESCG